jgi:hypothetical protein
MAIITQESTQAKSRNISGVNSETRNILARVSQSTLVHKAGINGDPLVEPLPAYAKADCENVIQGQNNAYIVLGRDRPTGKISGYGGKGHTGCGTIDLVAGRASAFITPEISTGLTTKSVETNPNPFLDASRIYISQKTDIDTNFKIVDGTVGNSVAKAAIAIKSDAIRIIAREGIKLVTSTDPINSRGANLISISGIDLIAGNIDEDLQPLVKGTNLVMAITDLVEKVSQLNGVVDSFFTYQLQYNSVLMNHTHPDAINIAIGALAIANPTGLTNGSSLVSPTVSSAGQKNIMALNGITKKDLISNKLNISTFKLNYLEQFSKKYINSRYNNTN